VGRIAKVIFGGILLFGLASGVRAQWSQDSLENTPICACGGEQGLVRGGLLPDGSGGAIAIWGHAVGFYQEIRAQHISHQGYLLWPEECGRTLLTQQRYMRFIRVDQILQTEDNGFYMSYWEYSWKAPDIPVEDSVIYYIQRFDSVGTPLWGERGIQVTPMSISSPYDTGYSAGDLVLDGKGGVIYLRTEWLSGPIQERHIYLQRLSRDGEFLWGTPGVKIFAICDPGSLNRGWGGQLIPDGEGGVILCLQGGLFQRVDSLGNKLWGERPVELWPGFILLPTDDGGAFLGGYSDDCDSSGYCARVQRIDGDGHLLWGEDGIQVSPSCSLWVGAGPALPDGQGGLIFLVGPDPPSDDIYIQRVSGSGELPWGEEWVPVCVGVEGFQDWPNFCSDGAGGAIIVWADRRNDSTGTLWFDIYAQRVDSSGTVRWRKNGIPISLRPYSQDDPYIVSDGAGGAIICWTDMNLDTRSRDIFAQQVNGNGELGVTGVINRRREEPLPEGFSLSQNYPNPFNPTTIINYELRIKN